MAVNILPYGLQKKQFSGLPAGGKFIHQIIVNLRVAVFILTCFVSCFILIIIISINNSTTALLISLCFCHYYNHYSH
jgi:hypothetical protein